MTATLIGYARCSTDAQDLTAQRHALTGLGVAADRIYLDKGLTGTNRSCNRATCGACSVLIDGVPFYSCHTLATEAVGKKIFTVEGLGDEKNLHPLQRIGYMYMAADCGFCTPGWEVTAKGLLDRNPNPTVEEVKAALAGHICRCAAYSAIVSTVIDAAAVLRGEAEIA